MKTDEPTIDDTVQQPTFLNQIVGLFPTVTSIPSDPPRNVSDQIRLYVSGTTQRLYIYDQTNAQWLTLFVGAMVGTGATSVSQASNQITIHS